MTTVVKHNMPELIRTLQVYSALTGKPMAEVMAHEAKEWSWGLHDALRETSPRPQSIDAAALARGYRMSRRGDSLAPRA